MAAQTQMLARTSALSSNTTGYGRLLIVDGDSLARWALVQFLERWFAVSAVDSLEEATALLERGDVTALVVSDDLPGGQIDAIEERARRRNPQLLTVRTVDGVAAKRPSGGCVRLEKPFQLRDLARLLGVPERELDAPDAAS